MEQRTPYTRSQAPSYDFDRGVWSIIARSSDVVGAYRLKCVCKTARFGVADYLETLPGLIVTGGWTVTAPGVLSPYGPYELTAEVWLFKISTLLWYSLPDLVVPRFGHRSCVAGGALVTVGGRTGPNMPMQIWIQAGHPSLLLMHPPHAFLPNFTGTILNSVEQLSVVDFAAASVSLPAMHSVPDADPALFNLTEWADGALLENNTPGSVTLLGGIRSNGQGVLSHNTAWDLDLTSGLCTPSSAPYAKLPMALTGFGSATGSDGRIFVVGAKRPLHLYQAMYKPLDLDWVQLPVMPFSCHAPQVHELEDGTLLVLGGMSYEAMMPGGGSTSKSVISIRIPDPASQWAHQSNNMRVRRSHFASAHIGGCVFIAGGRQDNTHCTGTVEVYREYDARFRLLGRRSDLPRPLFAMGCATW